MILMVSCSRVITGERNLTLAHSPGNATSRCMRHSARSRQIDKYSHVSKVVGQWSKLTKNATFHDPRILLP
jgi:N-dimethylarginine dimethylaminohydrolase